MTTDIQLIFDNGCPVNAYVYDTLAAATAGTSSVGDFTGQSIMDTAESNAETLIDSEGCVKTNVYIKTDNTYVLDINLTTGAVTRIWNS